MIDHRGRADNPGVGLPGLGILALLGAEDGRLLLGLADEQDAFRLAEACQVLGRDVVLALLPGEGDDRDGVGGGEGVDGPDEGVADRGEQGGGGEEMSAVVAEEAGPVKFFVSAGLGTGLAGQLLPVVGRRFSNTMAK
jgi:hypothetical protein